MKSVTVLTPTYNRAHTINRCYDSLIRQTCSDFEWIIVDDGSTDNTEELVSNWIAESEVDIQYIKKPNGGKHTALNIGFDIADSQYLIILDSDDMLAEDAVERIITAWDAYHDDDQIGVIVFLKSYISGGIIGESFLVTNTPISQFKQKQIGDKAETFRTGVIKKYHFPEIEGEKFLAEGIVWNRVSKDYLFVYVNETVYLCEYLDNGLSSVVKKLSINNPKGVMLRYNEMMILPYSLSKRLKAVLLYGTYSFFAGKSAGFVLKDSNRKILSLLGLPFSWLLYKYWKKKYAC